VKGGIFANIDLGRQRCREFLELVELRGRLADADLLAGNVFRLADRRVTGLLQHGNRRFGDRRREAIALHALLGDRRRTGNDVELAGFERRENAIPGKRHPLDLDAEFLADLGEEVDVQAGMFAGVDEVERRKAVSVPTLSVPAALTAASVSAAWADSVAPNRNAAPTRPLSNEFAIMIISPVFTPRRRSSSSRLHSRWTDFCDPF
jgi:hypothetical protein